MTACAERVRAIRRPSLPEVELLVVDDCERKWRVFHECYTFVLDRSPRPSAEWWYRGKTHLAQPGVSGLIEPGEVHVTRKVLAPGSITAIQVDPDTVAAIAREIRIASTPHFRSAQTASPAIHDALSAVSSAIERDAPRLEQETLLWDAVSQILTTCISETTRVGAEQRAVRIVRDYLHGHLTDRVTLDELAAAASISRYHLVRSFRRAYGIPPHAYLTELRVAAARDALRAGTSPRAVELGFADQSHLTRLFKRTLAVTPGRYAAAVAAG